jgi:hypothetical protein
MRFVATKTREQQSCLTLHRTRHLCIRQQTSVINGIAGVSGTRTQDVVRQNIWGSTSAVSPQLTKYSIRD